MPVAAYKAIVGQIMRTVSGAGYWSKQQLKDDRRIKDGKHHGFDMSKLTPSSLFYLPAQAANPADSFFLDYDEARRAPLDPYVWAEYASNHVLPEEDVSVAIVTTYSHPPTIPPRGSVVTDLAGDHSSERASDGLAARRERAIQKWRDAASTPKIGNRKFFDLGRDLANTGMDDADIARNLHAEAGFGRSPDQRRKQVKSILRSLRRRKAA
jgi:hypothetical protein